ncbi:hypothetical protein PRIPAC_86141 [Pristionchus pacificus]|uniref:Ribosomal protein n=1 Tax=Pristionchus pacificus TaxID=54126 RepID=A0A2A6BTH3_PRIPA|nr:hypothetical protein PRIPAC_86141 [Pristionchus pacificus]|eukprot:PDM69229.1 ribosomal protein [Pristionchus pacificus]
MVHGRNNGKKLMTVRIVKHSFEIIHLLTGESPVQVLVNAVINSGHVKTRPCWMRRYRPSSGYVAFLHWSSRGGLPSEAAENRARQAGAIEKSDDDDGDYRLVDLPL